MKQLPARGRARAFAPLNSAAQVLRPSRERCPLSPVASGLLSKVLLVEDKLALARLRVHRLLVGCRAIVTALAAAGRGQRAAHGGELVAQRARPADEDADVRSGEAFAQCAADAAPVRLARKLVVRGVGGDCLEVDLSRDVPVAKEGARGGSVT